MTRQQRINRWHTDFEQIRQQWQEWLDENIGRYQTTEDAWAAFRRQQQNHKLSSAVKGLHSAMRAA